MSHQRRNSTLIRMIELMRLLHRSPRSIPELAEQTHVTTRTIYRDLNALEEAHVPIIRDGDRGKLKFTRPISCPICTR